MKAGVRRARRDNLSRSVYQEFNLVPSLSARENIFLGREYTRGGFIAHREEHHAARALFRCLDSDIEPETPCRAMKFTGI